MIVVVKRLVHHYTNEPDDLCIFDLNGNCLEITPFTSFIDAHVYACQKYGYDNVRIK